VTLTGEGFETFDNAAASARCRVVGDDSAWCEYYDEPLLQVPPPSQVCPLTAPVLPPYSPLAAPLLPPCYPVPPPLPTPPRVRVARSRAAATAGTDYLLLTTYHLPLQVRTRARCLGVVAELTASSLVCIVPPVPNDHGTPGAATLQVALNGVDFTTLETAADFRLEPSP
jgi:hypothetical protein